MWGSGKAAARAPRSGSHRPWGPGTPSSGGPCGTRRGSRAGLGLRDRPGVADAVRLIRLLLRRRARPGFIDQAGAGEPGLAAPVIDQLEQVHAAITIAGEPVPPCLVPAGPHDPGVPADDLLGIKLELDRAALQRPADRVHILEIVPVGRAIVVFGSLLPLGRIGAGAEARELSALLAGPLECLIRGYAPGAACRQAQQADYHAAAQDPGPHGGYPGRSEMASVLWTTVAWTIIRTTTGQFGGHWHLSPWPGGEPER